MGKLFGDIDVKTDVKTSVIVGKDKLRLGRSILLPLAVYAGITTILYVVYKRKKKEFKL